MKPPPFAYLDPRDRTEALEALAQYGDEGKVLAGGQSLVPLLNMRLAQPAALIDINRINDLQYVTRREEVGRPGIAIGALTRQRTVEDTQEISARIPLLAEAIHWVGHPQIRNRGTIGGSVVHGDPAAELPTVFRTLDGIATVQSTRGSRRVPASDFFLYTFTAAMEADELLTEIWFPLPPPRTGQAFLEVARRHGDFALVAVATSLTLDEHGLCSEVRIGIGGAAPTPIRAGEAEASLRGQSVTPERITEASRLAAEETEPTGDVHADAAYRHEVAGTLTARALTIALGRAA